MYIYLYDCHQLPLREQKRAPMLSIKLKQRCVPFLCSVPCRVPHGSCQPCDIVRFLFGDKARVAPSRGQVRQLKALSRPEFHVGTTPMINAERGSGEVGKGNYVGATSRRSSSVMRISDHAIPRNIGRLSQGSRHLHIALYIQYKMRTQLQGKLFLGKDSIYL